MSNPFGPGNGSWRRNVALALAALLAAAGPLGAENRASAWSEAAPMPTCRSELAGWDPAQPS
jgi:hypothetical protein